MLTRPETLAYRLALALFLAIAVCFHAMASAESSDKTTIGVAANFRDCLDDLLAEYKRLSDDRIIVMTGSTGKLYAQITLGAPIDIFLAADSERPLRLIDEGFARAENSRLYAEGRLALWAPGIKNVDYSALFDRDIKRFAIANPNLAPYGAAAKMVIAALGAEDKLKNKIVYGENIAQTYAFIHTRNAQAGFISDAQRVKLSDVEQRHVWLVPQEMHSPIEQRAVLLNAGLENPAARRFYDFLAGGDAKVIIQTCGYNTP